MKKIKDNKTLKIVVHSIVILIILVSYGLLILGASAWNNNIWYQIFNPFVEFPLEASDINYVTYMILRIISLCFIVCTITHIVRLLLRIIGPKLKRGQSLASLFSSFAKYLGAIILIFAILGTLGVDTTVLLASAGILSLIVGLGAQPLIEDIFAGIFIVFEHTFEIGDIIVVDGFRGTVKEMGIRTTKIEDAGGDVKVINNSDIRTLINMTSKLSTAVCDVSISVQSLSDSAVVIRIIAECNETMRYQVQRDINREIKIIFDQNNILIPYPQIVVHDAKDQ